MDEDGVYIEDDSRSDLYEDESESTDESSSSSDSSSSEESEEESQVEEEWTQRNTLQTFPFTNTPSMNIRSAKTPLDFFKLLFNKTFINLLVSCINMNAIYIVTTQLRRPNEFKPTDVEEVYILLAVYFLMGYINHHHPHNLKLDNYISRERFCLLMRALAFKKKIVYDDHGDSRRSWYDAAKPIADYFNSAMKILVVPSKELNIYKSTIHWFNEFNLLKRKTERIRMHLLSDGNGVFHRVFLCHPNGKNKGDEVVKFLMKDFMGYGHSLYSCPFYTSVSLAEELLQNKTYMTGILNRKQQWIPALVKKKLKIGQIKTFYNSKGVCVCNIRKPHHTILALSTEHSATVGPYSRSADNQIVSQFKKQTIEMIKRNHTLSNNSPSDSSKKNNQNVLYLLQIMFMNAFSLCNARQTEKFSFSYFRKAVICEILPLPRENDNSDSDVDTDASLDFSTEDPGEVIHLPSELSKNKRRKVKNCRNCWLEHGIRKSTQFYCPQCPKKWGLCIGDCFRDFHNY